MSLYKLLILQKLLKTKAHMGSCISYSATQPYIYGFRNNLAIFDLDKTLVCLRRACNIIDLIIRSKGHLLFINTNPELNKLIKQTAERSNQSYINNKWIGGFLTNWNHMKNVEQHIQQFSSTKSFQNFNTRVNALAKPNTGILQNRIQSEQNKYNSNQTLLLENIKKNQNTIHIQNVAANLLTSKKLDLAEASGPRFNFMQKYFEGTQGLFRRTSQHVENQSSLNALPDCVIIFNANQNANAIKEASRNQIPIISIVHSNTYNELHNLITYPIPANENSVEFIYLVCNCFLKTILNSQKNLVDVQGRKTI